MIAAFWFLMRRSARNKLRSRLKRLKNPRYLAFALAGVGYMYFFAGRYFFRGVPIVSSGGDAFDLPAELVEIGAAVLLCATVVLAWCATTPLAPFAFREPEIQFLFPAPFRTTDLVRFKLLQAQSGVVVTLVILILMSRRWFAGRALEFFVPGAWLAFTTAHLHLTAIRIARHRLGVRGVGWALRTIVTLAVAVATGWLCGAWAWRSVGPLASSAGSDPVALRAFSNWVVRLAATGPARVLLFVPRLLVRPALAGNLRDFAVAAGPALLLLVAHGFWLVSRPLVLEEGAHEEAERREARRRRRGRSGAGRTVSYTKRRAPFRLAPAGRPETALAWKGLTQVARGLGWQATLRFTVLLLGPFAIALFAARTSEALAPLLATLCGSLVFILLLAGPRLLRCDFSQELPFIDILRAYPIEGRTIVLGTLAAPVLIVTALQWILLAAFVILTTGSALASIVSIPPAAPALALAILVLPMNLVSALLRNATIVLFPAWVTLGPRRGAGIEVLGQRIVTGVARLLVLTLCFAPAAAVFAVSQFAVSLALGAAATLPLSGLAAAVVLAIEAAVGIFLLGAFLDRFDPSDELDALQA